MLVPTTVTWVMVADWNVQESVALPDPVTLVGLMEHDVLLVVRLTIPENPFWGSMVMVDVAAVPALTVIDVGFAEMAKSCTV